MRLPFNVNLESRDGTVTKGAKITNGHVVLANGKVMVQKRPVLVLESAPLNGSGQNAGKGSGVTQSNVSSVGGVNGGGNGGEIAVSLNGDTLYNYVTGVSHSQFNLVNATTWQAAIGNVADTSTLAYRAPHLYSLSTITDSTGVLRASNPFGGAQVKKFVRFDSKIWALIPTGTSWGAYFSSNNGSTWANVSTGSPPAEGDLLQGGDVLSNKLWIYYLRTGTGLLGAYQVSTGASTFTTGINASSAGGVWGHTSSGADVVSISTKMYGVGFYSPTLSTRTAVYQTSDGSSFSLVSEGKFPARINQGVVYDTTTSILYVIGGTPIGSADPSDIVYSKDSGATWNTAVDLSTVSASSWAATSGNTPIFMYKGGSISTLATSGSDLSPQKISTISNPTSTMASFAST